MFLFLLQIFLSFARDQTDGANLEGSDSSSSTATDSELGANSAHNPYYTQFHKNLEFEGTGKGGPESSGKKSSPFVLPITGLDSDSESYSTKL